MHFFEQLMGTQGGLVLCFVVTAAVVVLSGVRLSIYGDALGERTGLGRGLIGLVFLAAVTSLPELVVSLTSVIRCLDPLQGADLATGNMLGSNIFNLLILALAALLLPTKFNPGRMESSHTGSTLYGLLLLLIFSGAFLWAGRTEALLPWLQCSPGVVFLPLAYILFLKREHHLQKKAVAEEHLPAEKNLTQLPALRFYSVLLGLCLLIFAGGISLSLLGSRMALPLNEGGFGLEASLIGTIFLAISTSLPELVISFSSIRMGFMDMAVGNVLGSNMFNLLIIFAADVALRGGSLLRYSSNQHWASVAVIALLTLFSALLLRSRSRMISSAIATIMIFTYLAVLVFVA